MPERNPNQKYLNKCESIKVIGKGSQGDFFGKIDNIICFIKDSGSNLNFSDVVDVKIINTTEKCLFSEMIPDGLNTHEF